MEKASISIHNLCSKKATIEGMVDFIDEIEKSVEMEIASSFYHLKEKLQDLIDEYADEKYIFSKQSQLGFIKNIYKKSIPSRMKSKFDHLELREGDNFIEVDGEKVVVRVSGKIILSIRDYDSVINKTEGVENV